MTSADTDMTSDVAPNHRDDALNHRDAVSVSDGAVNHTELSSHTSSTADDRVMTCGSVDPADDGVTSRVVAADAGALVQQLAGRSTVVDLSDVMKLSADAESGLASSGPPLKLPSDVMKLSADAESGLASSGPPLKLPGDVMKLSADAESGLASSSASGPPKLPSTTTPTTDSSSSVAATLPVAAVDGSGSLSVADGSSVPVTAAGSSSGAVTLLRAAAAADAGVRWPVIMPALGGTETGSSTASLSASASECGAENAPVNIRAGGDVECGAENASVNMRAGGDVVNSASSSDGVVGSAATTASAFSGGSEITRPGVDDLASATHRPLQHADRSPGLSVDPAAVGNVPASPVAPAPSVSNGVSPTSSPGPRSSAANTGGRSPGVAIDTASVDTAAGVPGLSVAPAPSVSNGVSPTSSQGPRSSAANAGGSAGPASGPGVSGAPRYACDVCNKTFSAKRSMIHHRRMIHEGGRLKKKQDAAAAAAAAVETAVVSVTADVSDRYDGWVWWDL